MPPSLRQAYLTQNRELQAVRAELTNLRTKPVDDPEKTSLIEQGKTLQARIRELEGELTSISWERSDEYKEKYYEPFAKAYNRGRSITASLKASNEENGEPRQGTSEDFDEIMQIPDDNTAADRAFELFGTKANMILWHRENVKALDAARADALEQHRKTSEEAIQKKTAELATHKQQSEQQQRQLTEAFVNANKRTIEERAELMSAADTDETGARLLQSEEALTDLAFHRLRPDQIQFLPEAVRERLVDGKLPPEEMVKLHSAVYTKARAFGLVVHKLQSKINELTAELEDYRGSEPGRGGLPRGQGGPKELSAEEEIDQIAAGNR